jgi:hypothetical protein
MNEPRKTSARAARAARAARVMKPIPIAAAKRIAEEHGYDQVIIYARRVGEKPAPHGEHMTTYGVDQAHCDVAARIGERLQRELLGWRSVKDHEGGER